MLDLELAFILIAVILTVTTLASWLIERTPISFPLLFLALGVALGEGALGVVELGPHEPILEIVATLTLTLVLFLDAVKLQVDEIGKRWVVPFLVLVPGTGLIIVLGALPLSLLLGFGWAVAFMGGAILASTDPVVLREILRDPRIPRSVRQVLQIEGGMNDIVVLPVILILVAVVRAEVGGIGGWAAMLAQLLLVGPLVGFAVGALGSWLMMKLEAHTYVRTDHLALYGIGLVLASYGAASAAGGDGFLAAFFAGLAVVVLNRRLCDCFLEYGEVTAEVAMLLAFVVFGAVLSGLLGSVSIGRVAILSALVIFVFRPSVIGLVLARAEISWKAHAFVSWFGPRGLNSLLLGLLVVQANVPGAESLLAVVGSVVLASVTIHGATAAPFSRWYGHRAATETLVEEREGTAAGLFAGGPAGGPRISTRDLHHLQTLPNPPVVLDVRSRSSFAHDNAQIPSSVRVLPDRVGEWAAAQRGGRTIVAYCACIDEATSARVVQQLRRRGLHALALDGGFDAWAARYPVEPIQAAV